MAKYRAGIIGCGNIAGAWNSDRKIDHVLTHAKAYEKHPDTELVSCCDSVESKAAAFRERWGAASSYTSVGEMLKREDLDLVSVCVPTPAHLAVVEAICTQAKRPKAILLEKPVAGSLIDARTIAARTAEAGVICNVHYIRRFDTAFQKLRSSLNARELGRVQAFRGLYTKGLLNSGSHLLNLLRFFFGAVAGHRVLDHVAELEGDPTVSAYLEFSDGARGTIQGLREECYSVFELDIMLERGAVMIRDFGHYIDTFVTAGDPLYPGYRVLSRDPVRQRTDLNNAVLNYVDNTVMAVQKQAAPICPVEDALLDMETIADLQKDLYDEKTCNQRR